MTWGGTLRPEGPPTEPGLRLSPHTRASGKEALGPSWTSEQRDGKSGSVQHTRVSVMGSLCPPPWPMLGNACRPCWRRPPLKGRRGRGLCSSDLWAGRPRATRSGAMFTLKSQAPSPGHEKAHLAQTLLSCKCQVLAKQGKGQSFPLPPQACLAWPGVL